ncbi:MAG: GNAT family N-acetyltransferase [Gammaproteobacteria bacterium]|nr:GNAT family N-acetyltransferase [Gammaproteobacteria bacterium]
MTFDVQIRHADWHDTDDHKQLSHLRRTVFIDEQQVPEKLEWDDDDEEALHLIAFLDQEPVACARLLSTGRVGRMAVLKHLRGNGIGHQLMSELLNQADHQGLLRLTLHAQTHAADFYLKHGFISEGEPFSEADIPHQKMSLELQNRRSKTILPFDQLNPKQHQLGITGLTFQVDSLKDSQQAALFLAQQAKRTIRILTRTMDPMLLSNEAFVDALSQMIRSGQRANVQILISDPSNAIKAGHRLTQLCQRLSSFIQVRRLQKEHNDLNRAFIMADDTGLLLRNQGEQPQGLLKLHAGAEAKEMNHFFLQAWEMSSPDPEFRQLSI